MRKQQIIAVSLFVLCLLSGCTQVNNNGAKTQSYSPDGYLGLTNTNPNLPSHPSYHTYEVDHQLIHQAAMSVDGVRDTDVQMGNATATVHLHVDKGITPQQAERIKAEALQAITYAMPRYTVQVSVQ